MEIRPIGSEEPGGVQPLGWPSMAPSTIIAPAHPLADRDGRVPVEVFDAPPELMRAILASPIKAVSESAALRPSGAGTDGPTVSASRPSYGSSVEIDL